MRLTGQAAAAAALAAAAAAHNAVAQVVWTASDDAAAAYLGNQNDSKNKADNIVFYGDEVGYSGGGVGDVDGDGYHDYVVNWYRTEIDGVGFNWNEVGVVRVYSGKDGSQIGQDIWGKRDHNIVSHEMSWLRDIDGRWAVRSCSEWAERRRRCLGVCVYESV